MQDKIELGRTRGSDANPATLRHEDIELDLANRAVRRGSRAVRIGPTERKLLEALMTNSGKVMTRQELIDRAWRGRKCVDKRTVDVCIGRLRRAINVGNKKDPITTLRNVGYVFGCISGEMQATTETQYQEQSTIQYNDLIVDRRASVVFRRQRKVRLAPLDYKLLLALLTHPGVPLSRSDLIRLAWDGKKGVDERIVDVHIAQLRASLNRGRDQDYIRTIHGFGYSFG